MERLHKSKEMARFVRRIPTRHTVARFAEVKSNVIYHTVATVATVTRTYRLCVSALIVSTVACAVRTGW